MDDNDNYLEFSKMNFSPFSTQFTNVNQLTKFTQNLTAANGQVLGLVSSGDNGVQFLRPLDPSLNSAASAFQAQTNAAANMSATQTFITLPITMPGAKPGDAQQTVQIQVLNPNPIPQVPKFQMGQMQIPIQSFQQGTTVLTVAYSPQDGELLPNHGLTDGVTVLAAIQPQDLQLLAQQAQTGITPQLPQPTQQPELNLNEDKAPNGMINIKSEPIWTSSPLTVTTSHPITSDLSDFLHQRAHGMNLQHYLKFNNTEPTNIKKELFEESVSMNQSNNDSNDYDCENNSNASLLEEMHKNDSSKNEEDTSFENQEDGEIEIDANGKPRKKRKSKKKTPKPKRPKPGQVHIATALDGTILFCCPECQMAYPEKESLEQHLVVHKIERRYICDLCGAGLKRKEHLERHKLGHNPERPYVCAVCMKGFKRKEHLNLHAVIHSGQKTEICNECGKGFYRKDHLRKHIKSHITKRLKEEANMANSIHLTVDPNRKTLVKQETELVISNELSKSDNSTTLTTTSTTTVPICLPQEVTIHVPTSDNTTLPVQIQVPHLVAQTTTRSDGSTNTSIVIPSS